MPQPLYAWGKSLGMHYMFKIWPELWRKAITHHASCRPHLPARCGHVGSEGRVSAHGRSTSLSY
jgi:hypothetical protein